MVYIFTELHFEWTKTNEFLVVILLVQNDLLSFLKKQFYNFSTQVINFRYERVFSLFSNFKLSTTCSINHKQSESEFLISF